MLGKIAQHLGFNEAILQLRGARQQLLASNIANVDTPNFKARDFDFSQALQHAMAKRELKPLGLTQTHQRHLQLPSSVAQPWSYIDIAYRRPNQPSIDGNTVDMDIEMTEFTNNALHYQAALTFMQRRIEGLKAALQPQG